MRHTSSGVLVYGPGIRAVAKIDPEIVRYYRKLIPAYHWVNPQRYEPHITVVRTGKEFPVMDAWDKYDGEIIQYQYSPEIHFDGSYWYLNVWSPRIGEIRKELGLPEFRGRREIHAQCYHISLGNSKDLDETLSHEEE